MAKKSFKTYDQGQTWLFPQSLDEKLSADSPARLVNQIVDKLDITKIIDTYRGGGTSSYHPRMMLKIVLFAYLSNIYSCRKIEDAARDRLSFMWLSGMQTPDHNTINRFRTSRLKDTIHTIFTQVVLMLVDMGHLTLNESFIDGTKMESRANRYTFVWRKSVEKNRIKLEAKIRRILEQIEEGIAQDNHPDDDPPPPIDSEELRLRIEAINRENRSKEELKAIKTLEKKHLPKLQEYEQKLDTLDGRGSYSKTDPDATFMRMKDDQMMNGQLKPAYNLQIATENQFYIHYDFFANPTDFLTFILFNKRFGRRYGFFPKKVIADSGYGSEENYDFMQTCETEGFVKYPMFHKEQKKSFRNNGFLSQNLFYNAEKDYFVCPMGQHMERVKTGTRRSENGYVSEVNYYQAKCCEGFPLRCLCHKSQENRTIEVNPRLNAFRREARERLTSKEGHIYRSRRPIEPEAVFGQTKENKQYKRFRHFGGEKVKMDFAIFAIAFNIGKLYNKGRKTAFSGKKSAVSGTKTGFIVIMTVFIRKKEQNQTYLQSSSPLAA
jgi:transposase